MSELKPVKCQHCGAPASAGARACGYCGVAFDAKHAAAGAGATSSTSANPADAEIEGYLRNGDLLSAIRVYRQSRKCSLLDAKNACEAWQKRVAGGG